MDHAAVAETAFRFPVCVYPHKADIARSGKGQNAGDIARQVEQQMRVRLAGFKKPLVFARLRQKRGFEPLLTS